MERLLTVAEAAEFLRTSRVWIYRQTERGLLPHLKIGRLTRFDPQALARWSKAQGRSAERRVPESAAR